MAIKIVVDSASDYPDYALKQDGITCVHMGINFGDEYYSAGVDITTDEFFEKLIEGKYFPKTSQPSLQEYLELFEDAKEKNDSIVYIALSSKLSGTYQSAIVAKQMCDYDEIYILDSQMATIPIAIMAKKATQLVSQGYNAKDIYDKLKELQPKIKLYAVIDTLEYLYKGGRLSKAATGLGMLANIKPVVTLKDGNVEVKAKAMGRKKATAKVIEFMKSSSIDEEYPVLGIYTYNKENCLHFMAELAENGINTYPDPVAVGSTIGTHVGPGSFGIVYVEK